MDLSFELKNESHLEDGVTPGTIPVVTISDVLNGELKVKGLKSIDREECDIRIEIILEGFMTIEFDTGPSVQPKMMFKQKLMSMTQSMSVEQYTKVTSEDSQYYPFRFDVRSWLHHSIEEKPYFSMMLGMQNNFLPLPPSLLHAVQPQLGTDGMRADAMVTYGLSASLSLGSRIISSVRQPIVLLFPSGPSPPVCVSDYVGEYQTQQRVKLRNTFFRAVGDLQIEAQEPMPLKVRLGAQTASIDIQLNTRLCLSTGRGNSGPHDHVHVEADVTWQLRSFTFISVREQYKPSTLKEALLSPSTFLISSMSPARKLSMVWREFKPAYSDAETVESVQCLRLSLAQIGVLTPTFWSQHVARRYSISLQVKVTAPGNATLELQVPIQIEVECPLPDVDEGGSARGDTTTTSSSADNDNHDELLPIYRGH